MKKEVVKQTKSLFISAGHSFKDPGAYGNGYTEADIVLHFRDLVADALRDKVEFTKDGDRGQNLELIEAVRLAKTRDVAVEFHCNAFKDPRVGGVETLSADFHKPLGQRLCAAVSDELGIPYRGAKSEGDGAHSRLAFVRDGGGIILELFFLTNKKELMAFLPRQRYVANAVAKVLVDEVSHGA